MPMNLFTYSLTYSLTYPFTYPLTQLITQWLTYSPTDILTYSPTHSHNDSLTCSITHSLTCSITQSLNDSLTCTHSLAQSLTHSMTHSLAHSLTHAGAVTTCSIVRTEFLNHIKKYSKSGTASKKRKKGSESDNENFTDFGDSTSTRNHSLLCRVLSMHVVEGIPTNSVLALY